MRPTPGDVHVNTPLTMISVAFMQKATNFVAASAFPNVPVPKQSDRYYTYDRGMFNRDEMKRRAPGTESAGGHYTVDNTPTYFCDVWAWHKDIDDQMRANADSVIGPDRDATELATLKGLIRREKQWTTKYFNTGIWTTDITGVAAAPGAGQVLQWNDAASNPIENIRVGKTTVLQSTGFEPNKLVIGQQVWDALIDHPDILDRIKYGQTAGRPAMTTRELVAQILEIDEVLVMKSIENTAAEGLTNSHSFIGGKKALLCYAAPSPGLLVPSAGYTFSWTGYMGAQSQGQRISRFRVDTVKSDRVEIEMAFDMKVIAADLGFFWNTIVA